MDGKIEAAIAASTNAFRAAIREESGGTGVICLTAGGNLSTIGRLFEAAGAQLTAEGRCHRCGMIEADCICAEWDQPAGGGA